MKKRVSMARMVLAGLMVYIGGLAGVASAADSTPIRIVWPYPAGGEVDGVLRLMAESMAADSGRSFIVENRTGAAGLIAMQAVASANPDGNTVLAAPMGAVALLPHTKKLPFSPLDTFVPVCQFAELGGYVFSSKHLGFKSFDDLLAYARQNPGKLSYSSGGIGTQVHLLGEMLQRTFGIQMLHVPYKGPTEAVGDLIAGRLDVMLEAAALTYARAGKIDILGSLTEQRPPDMPNLPTASQLHLGHLLTAWFGLFVRKEVPAQDTARLEALCDRAMHNPTLLTRMKAFQAQPAYKPGKELDSIWRADDRTQAELIRSLNIKLDR